jgi:hypothetical protein
MTEAARFRTTTEPQTAEFIQSRINALFNDG